MYCAEESGKESVGAAGNVVSDVFLVRGTLNDAYIGSAASFNEVAPINSGWIMWSTMKSRRLITGYASSTMIISSFNLPRATNGSIPAFSDHPMERQMRHSRSGMGESLVNGPAAQAVQYVVSSHVSPGPSVAKSDAAADRTCHSKVTSGKRWRRNAVCGEIPIMSLRR